MLSFWRQRRIKVAIYFMKYGVRSRADKSRQNDAAWLNIAIAMSVYIVEISANTLACRRRRWLHQWNSSMRVWLHMLANLTPCEACPMNAMSARCEMTWRWCRMARHGSMAVGRCAALVSLNARPLQNGAANTRFKMQPWAEARRFIHTMHSAASMG